MPSAEFGEREYETAANLELGLGKHYVFTPDQVLEGVLGFDAATGQPPDATVWLMLQTQAPGGISLLPTLLPAWKNVSGSRFPPYLVSLILQYKRPSYCAAKRARHYRYWKGPYFEFCIRQGQHKTLCDLEDTVESDALVRYASPAFWQTQALFRHQQDWNILENTTFVLPSSISPAHTKWTYNAPGLNGLANPDPEEIASDDWASIQSHLAEHASETTIGIHLRSLEHRLLGGRPMSQADVTLSRALTEFRLRPEKQDSVLALVRLAQFFSKHGLTWLVVGLEAKDVRAFEERVPPLPIRAWRRIWHPFWW